ncbi:MAG: hypothetical protein JSR36_10795 [Proteobacteria bacterium]|nr:hypothetical protein [Pseudomonadota bacterium]
MLALCGGVAGAQEIYLLGGAEQTRSQGEHTYAYGFEYTHNLSEHFFASYGYLNEGHVTDHHRDGVSGQIWLRLLSRDRRWDLALGAGPYRYYDTTTDQSDGTTIDAHGWGGLFSAAVHWYIRAPWIAQLRYNHVQVGSSISTDSLLLGIGWQLDEAQRPGPVVPPARYGFDSPFRNEISGFVGNSIVNNFNSPTGAAWMLEYRRNWTPYIDLTGSFIDEGDAKAIKRQGVAAQVWLTRSFWNQRASVGIGAGPYFARDKDQNDTHVRVLGLGTTTLNILVTDRLNVRISWHRTLTSYSRDTDVLLAGLGVRF